MRNKRLSTLALIALLGISTATATYALSEDLTKLLKLFGIGYVVQRFSGDINQFINQVTLKHNAATERATKVVPIVSIGRGGYIGAAQVTGTAEALKRVKAVGQGEIDVSGGDIRLRALIPVDTTNPTQGIKGISGVGVTALIDFRL
jgi:uncharacterized protein (DUF697 family)